MYLTTALSDVHGLEAVHQATPEGIEWLINLDIEIESEWVDT